MKNRYMKKAEEWLNEQGIRSLKKPYYLPDLRIAFVAGMVAAEKELQIRNVKTLNKNGD